jgi:hypothetical protein
MSDLRSTLERVLIEHTNQLLNRGRQPDLDRITGFGPAASYLWAGACCDSQFQNDKRLLSLAMRTGDQLARRIPRELGPRANPPHVPVHDLCDAFAAVGPALPKQRRNRWQRVLEDSGQALLSFLNGKWQQLGKPGPYTGTGPNHLVRHAATLFRLGRVLRRPEWSRRGSGAIRRLVRVQDPQTGCFTETHGPVVAYHWVTLDGLARFLTSGGGKFALAPLQLGIEFAAQQLYPDLVRLDLFDERNRLGRSNVPYVRAESCVYHPLGRRLLSRVLAANPQQMLAGTPSKPKRYNASILSEFARALTASFDSVQQRVPVESPNMTLRVADYGFIRRRDGWFHALSSLSSAGPPHNPFHMDRTINFVLYHDAVGRIVAGGNDKHTLDSATFRVLESGECGYFPAVAGRIRTGRQGDRLDLDYGAARAGLTVVIKDGRTCQLTAENWSSMSWRQIDLNLQLPLPLGQTVRLGSRRRPLVLRPERARRDWPTDGRLELPGSWRIDTPPDARLVWPYLPYNPYGGPPHLVAPSEAIGVLSAPLEPVRTRATVTIRILSRQS